MFTYPRAQDGSFLTVGPQCYGAARRGKSAWISRKFCTAPGGSDTRKTNRARGERDTSQTQNPRPSKFAIPFAKG